MTNEKVKKRHKKIPGPLQFLIGGTSGMLAISVVQPADLLKTRMQLLDPKNKKSLGEVAREIIRTEGVLGLYHGYSAAFFRQATYTTGRLGCFNYLSDLHKEKYGVPNYSGKLLIATFSGGVGSFFGTPADVALIRMTGDGRLPPEKRRNYKNVFNALGRIVREEGVTALWSGVGSTVVRSMVVSAAQLGTYSQVREMLLPLYGNGIFLHVCASLISGLVTTVASQPVDIVKTRVQNASTSASQISVLMNIIKTEGVLALWTGFLPTYARIGPHTMLTFIFMEQLNALYFKLVLPP